VDRRSRLPAWAEKDSDVMVAITRPAFFDRDFCRSERLFPALIDSFCLIY
jgi:hypothetical protein